MSTIAEFTIIGRVRAIKEVGSTLRVSIASNYARKDDRGEWIEHTRWNEVSIFSEGKQGYVRRNLDAGDLIFTSGTLGQNSWEKNGEKVYGVTLACERIERLCKGPNRQEAGEERASVRRQSEDSDIPF